MNTLTYLVVGGNDNVDRSCVCSESAVKMHISMSGVKNTVQIRFGSIGIKMRKWPPSYKLRGLNVRVKINTAIKLFRLWISERNCNERTEKLFCCTIFPEWKFKIIRESKGITVAAPKSTRAVYSMTCPGDC